MATTFSKKSSLVVYLKAGYDFLKISKNFICTNHNQLQKIARDPNKQFSKTTLTKN